jgi:DMSO/TMAO reductase YedYZ heme-binding membrane subunit
MPRRFDGWWVTAACALLVVAACAAALALHGTEEAGLRSGVRTTARTSVAIFLLVFTASSLHSLTRAPLATWMLRNRTYLGLGFAFSHLTHAGFLFALGARVPEFRAAFSVTGSAAGITAYAFLLAMTITSFPGPRRALGKRWWKVLHKTGMYVLWVVFAVTYTSRAVKLPGYIPITTLLFAALALRGYARWRAKRGDPFRPA